MDKKQLAETLITTVLEHSSCHLHRDDNGQGNVDVHCDDLEQCIKDILNTIEEFEEK